MAHSMQTRQQSKEKSKETPPLKVGKAIFRPQVGFENFKEKQHAGEDAVNEDYDNEDDNQSENSRESTPVLDDPSSSVRNSPLRNASAEPEDNTDRPQVEEYVRSNEELVRRRGTRNRRDLELRKDYGWNVRSNKNTTHNTTVFSTVNINVVSSDRNNYWIYLVCVLLAISVGIGMLYLIFFGKEHEVEPPTFEVNELYLSPKDLKLEESLDDIRERFPSQDENVWYTFGAGIKSITVKKPNKPSVFLMLYENNDKTPTCLADKISKLAISYITGGNTSPVMVDGVELKEDKLLNKDSGELIVRYNETVRRKGSLIVTNLHEVPGNIAKSFHFFCDSYSPLIERAVYFFTLSTQGERLKKNNLQHVAEKTIRNLWSDTLGDNLLDPLITRLTGYVIRVVPESDMDSCDA